MDSVLKDKFKKVYGLSDEDIELLEDLDARSSEYLRMFVRRHDLKWFYPLRDLGFFDPTDELQPREDPVALPSLSGRATHADVERARRRSTSPLAAVPVSSNNSSVLGQRLSTGTGSTTTCATKSSRMCAPNGV